MPTINLPKLQKQIEWANTLETSLITKDSQNEILKLLINFNLFEAKLFKESRALVHERLMTICKTLKDETWFDIKDYEMFGKYFSERYVDPDGTQNYKFDQLKLSREVKQETFETLLKFKTEGKRSSDQMYYYLLISYRFRNNLFHGSKDPLGLNNYTDCFAQINTLINRLLLDMCKHEFSGLTHKF